MQQLINKIEQWAEDRNLIKGCTPLDQAMKLFSEFGELADAVAKDDLDGIKDGIGDVFVVVSIMYEQTKNHIQWTQYETAGVDWCYSQKELVVELSNAIYHFISLAHEGEADYESLYGIIGILKFIAENVGFTLQQCVEHAYNEIKDRKGIMYNGTFIKESDPRYAELVSA